MEIDCLLGPHRRDVQEQFLRQITMRIDETDAMPLLDEVAQERRLPRTRLADDVGVVAGISQIETKRQLSAPCLSHTDVKIMLVHL